MRYVARCPLRLDLAGYWTSMPLYGEREGSVVLGASIQPYAHGLIARPAPQGTMHLLRGDRHYVSYALDLPRGSGLGGSSAQTVLWVTLIKTAIANVSDRMEVATIARSIETQLGAGAFDLDTSICARGGFGVFSAADTVAVQDVAIEPARVSWLENCLLLAYTGPAPPANALAAGVSERYARGTSAVRDTFATMKALVPEARSALLNGDSHLLAEITRAQWALQRQLEPHITTPSIDITLEFALKNGALAGRLCGAGGGGCLLLVVPFERRAQLRAALTQRRVRTIDVQFDSYGVHLSTG